MTRAFRHALDRWVWGTFFGVVAACVAVIAWQFR
jgi:hypothetical protein